MGVRRKKATVVEVLHQNAWIKHITGPLTMRVLLEFDRLCDMLEGVQLSSEPDTFTWSLTADHSYSAVSAYGAMFLGSSRPLRAK